MSHAVETMAFTNETPWHGLGTRVSPDLTPAEMCRAAGLDWKVSLKPMYTESMVRGKDNVWSNEKIKIPGRRALVRESDGRVFCTTGDRWKPVQNEVALSFFSKFTEAGSATLETAGSLHDGKMVWGLARLGADFKLPGGDIVKGYILLVSPHEAGRAIVARVTPIRVVCANTMALAMSKDAKFEQRFSHVREFNPGMAAETFGAAREQIRAFERNAHILKRMNMTESDVIRTLAPIFQPVKAEKDLPADDIAADPSKMNKPMQALMSDYYNAPGADPGNAWGALAACTRYLDHNYGKSRDQRMFHSMLAVGAQQKREFLKELLKMADSDGAGLELESAE